VATRTLGTNASTSLTAVVWNGMATATADVRALNQLIRDDKNPRHSLSNQSGAFVKEGILYVPNRGDLKLFPGDVVAVDATSGQVIVLTAYGLSAGPWTLT
jgi:hypothetical protein